MAKKAKRYYWDNSVRVQINRAKMVSSMRDFSKHDDRVKFDNWYSLDTIVEGKNERELQSYKKQKEKVALHDACNKLLSLFND